MLRILSRKSNGQAAIEYVVVIVIFLIALLVFQKYIVRAFSGRWKTVGDSIGDGRIYDPNHTLECGFDSVLTNAWYDRKCFERDCTDQCFSLAREESECKTCITACQKDRCTDPLPNLDIPLP